MFGVRRTTQARQYVLLMLHVTVTMQASACCSQQPGHSVEHFPVVAELAVPAANKSVWLIHNMYLCGA